MFYKIALYILIINTVCYGASHIPLDYVLQKTALQQGCDESILELSAEDVLKCQQLSFSKEMLHNVLCVLVGRDQLLDEKLSDNAIYALESRVFSSEVTAFDYFMYACLLDKHQLGEEAIIYWQLAAEKGHKIAIKAINELTSPQTTDGNSP